jgi:predicted lipoprotein with Yx(FWY)xxD motif
MIGSARRRLCGPMVVAAVVAVCVAGCGSSTKTSTSPSSSSSSSSVPGPVLSTANAEGLGTVVVDDRGYTLYVFTSATQKNVPCSDASGCTKLWPSPPLPAGVGAAKAGSGLQASLLGTMKLSDGNTYPTYNGYLLYGYVGDSGPAQSHGQGIHSFGGVWYVINAAGVPVTTVAAAPTSSP